MAAILRKLSPFKPVVVTAEKEHEYDYENHEFLSTEYSIAMEYTGSPITHEIPQAFPVDFDRISTAFSSSPSRNLSLVVPVIQPIATAKPNRLKPKPESEIIELPPELESYMNPRRSSSDSTDENSDGPSSRSNLSSETVSEEDQENEDQANHKRKPSVTFLEPESNDTWRSDSFAAEDHTAEATPPRRRAAREGRRGSCYRCRRGGRLTWKEECIVCSAKYCNDCVLRSMGSMPEGRKCVGCIGERIDEAARRRLGRSSRLLRRLLCDREVEHIMDAEANCPANQLPAGLIQVNGRRLSADELVLLKTCKRPPRRLKPGQYWYDKVSGFWGKVGQVYSDIISPQLNVGGDIHRKCSNGNTNIRINNREITKAELWILQVAGVPCEGDVHYWVNPDGTYQEEGMNMKGKIWDKPRVKLACTLLSLPILSGDSEPLTTEEVKRAAATQSENTKLYNFLLLGSDQSGTSTIFKQVKRLCDVPFSDEERQSIKSMIQSKLYGYIGLLLEGRERFEEEEESLSKKGKSILFDQPGPSGIAEQETMKYSIGQRLKSFEEWLLKVMTSGNLEVMIPAATREYAQYIEDLWNDPAIKATYSRRNELETLPRAASYFLDRAIEISRMDYEPTDLDILYAEGISSSNNVASIEFPCPRFDQDNNAEVLPEHNPDLTLRSRLIRAHPNNLGDNCKWLSMFEESDIVLFCFSLSDYAEPEKMHSARRLFENVATHPDFKTKPFLLLLNKFDLLEETIERVPLSRCDWFSDFKPVVTINPSNPSTSGGARGGNNPPLPHRAFQYIAMKFKTLFKSLTGRKLYVSLINGLESDTVDESLRYAAEVLKWEQEQRPKISAHNQISDASIEASSSS